MVSITSFDQISDWLHASAVQHFGFALWVKYPADDIFFSDISQKIGFTSYANCLHNVSIRDGLHETSYPLFLKKKRDNMHEMYYLVFWGK